VLVRSHAGCEQRDVIAALKERGLWDGKMRSHVRGTSRPNGAESNPELSDRGGVALAIWRSTILATHTLVQAHLATRGLILPVPPSIRFHRGLKHPSGGTWPCMVAPVTRGAEHAPLAIHRTSLPATAAAGPRSNPRK
jgi:hypothetical protein